MTGEDAPAAVAVGQHAERDAHQRAEHHRDRHRERELGVGEAELVLEVGAERAEQPQAKKQTPNATSPG